MTRRRQLILTLVVAALLVALGLLWWWLRPRPEPAVTATPPVPVVGGLVATGTGTAAAPAAAPPLVTQAPATQSTLEAVALTFAERYGSYSTQANFENLRDALPLMTSEFRAATQATIQRGAPPAETFFGVTTRALSVQIITLDAAEVAAQLLIQTQREETRGSSVRAYYQGLLVDAERTGSTWLVAGVKWQ